jgi:hypothetical protein
VAYRTPPEKTPSEGEQRAARRRLPQEFLAFGGMIFAIVVVVLLLVYLL